MSGNGRREQRNCTECASLLESPLAFSEEQQFVRDATAEHARELPGYPAQTHALAELIDLAESNNPETRVAWERARAQAASFGVAKSELYPMLAVAASSRTGREELFFGNRFNAQFVQIFEATLDLSYTVFDFGARRGRINAARAQLLATNFAFNDTPDQMFSDQDSALLSRRRRIRSLTTSLTQEN